MKNTIFDVLIEIPRGSRNKYEFDKEKGKIRLDRVLYSPMTYPADYGYIPNTLALDGDPLDALVLLTTPTIPGCLIEVKPIGIFLMADDKGRDEKILCVPVADPNYNHLNDIDQVSSHTYREIEHFFRVYKDLESKKVMIDGWKDAAEAIKIYDECLERYGRQIPIPQ
ncbi:MAG: inorganic diphosphatase [Flavobacteriales bacterium AspAUS03]